MQQTVEQREIPIFKVLYKKLVVIILSIVLFALVGLGYCAWRVPPKYVASRSVILRTTLNGNAAVSTQASLAKMYLETVAELIKSPKVIDEVNSVANEKGLFGDDVKPFSANNIEVKHGEKSLIFSITYTEKDPELAEQKLDLLIETFSASVNFKENIEAEKAELIYTQKKCDVTPSFSYAKYTVIGGLFGAVGSVMVVLLLYVLDNTLNSKEELEEISGVSLLACINKERS